jgi:hypoxanthine phosphoribosyltransferase
MEQTAKISYDELQQVMHDIASELQRKFFGWNLKRMKLVPISNGGIIPATILATALGIKLTSLIAVSTYEDKKQTKQTTIQGGAITSSEFKDIIFVDDIIDTGNTILSIEHQYKNFALVIAPVGKMRGITAIKNSLLVQPPIIIGDNVWMEFPWEREYKYVRIPTQQEIERAQKRGQ